MRRRALVVIARRVSLDQSHEHSDDALEALLARPDLFRRQLAFGDEDVEAGGALQRRAVGDVEEAAAVLGRVLAVALGNIQWDGRRSAIQLILYGPPDS